jgi:hypothetical protein
VAGLLRLGGSGDQMIAEADERGLCFDGAGSEQNVLAPPRVCPLLAQRPAWALDPVNGHAGEAGLTDLAGQAAGVPRLATQ